MKVCSVHILSKCRKHDTECIRSDDPHSTKYCISSIVELFTNDQSRLGEILTEKQSEKR